MPRFRQCHRSVRSIVPAALETMRVPRQNWARMALRGMASRSSGHADTERQSIHASNFALWCRPAALSHRSFSRSASAAAEADTDTDADDNGVHNEDEGPVEGRLNRLVRDGEIERDGHQYAAARELDRLYHDLMSHDPGSSGSAAGGAAVDGSNASGTGSGATDTMDLITTWFGSIADGSSQTGASAAPPARGVYLFGGVGCGKTFLMDGFYNSIDSGPWAQNKQMVHYHKFMLTVHEHMHRARKIDPAQQQGDLLAPVIASIAQQGQLICLDEFQVTDVADAMILQRLFAGLWHTEGCVVVTTSNRAPEDLYWNGLQRDRFLPFIDDLNQNCSIVNMLSSEKDYRMLLKAGGVFLDDDDDDDEDDNDNNDEASQVGQAADATGASQGASKNGKKTKSVKGRRIVQQVYFCGKEEREGWRKLYNKLTDRAAVAPTSLQTQGRQVRIPLACLSSGVCRFTFADLCQKALGAADYLVIGKHFHTVFVEKIPIMTLNELNWLRRFITFIDTMYESKVTLVLHTSKADSLENVFQLGEEYDKDSIEHDEVFAWDRTQSRLAEMSSSKYLQQQWEGRQKHRRAAGDTGGDDDANRDDDDDVSASVEFPPCLDDSTVDQSRK